MKKNRMVEGWRPGGESDSGYTKEERKQKNNDLKTRAENRLSDKYSF